MKKNLFILILVLLFMLGGCENTPANDEDKVSISYITEDNNGDLWLHYDSWYRIGEPGALGLMDSSGRQVLKCGYQDILSLPEGFILKENDLWYFYNRSEERLTETGWEQVWLHYDDKDILNQELIVVSREGKLGAVDQQGNIVIEPLWEEIQPPNGAVWPLYRVCSREKYGFLDEKGNIVVEPVWDYALLSTALLKEERAVPAIYLLQGERWARLLQQKDGSWEAIEWDQPPAAEMAEMVEMDRVR